MVEFKGFTKSYGKNKVYTNFDFKFNEGINGLVGINGSGKTTLFECIYGLKTYDGIINKPDSIFYLPTEMYFYPRVRGMEFLEFVCEARNERLDKEKVHRINQFLRLPLTDYALGYSTGMKQKLMLLSTALISCDLLLLDEPFSGLDIESQKLAIELVRSLKSNFRTILITSHTVNHLAECCDLIHQLKDGSIIHTFEAESFGEIDAVMTELLADKLDSFKSVL